MNPLAGQSFNPSAKAHKGVLDKVFVEEKTIIEREKVLSLKNQSIVSHVHSDGQVSSESDSDTDKVYDLDFDDLDRYQPDRMKKKTKHDRHRQ